MEADPNTQKTVDAMARVKELALLMRGGEYWAFKEKNGLVPLWQYETEFSRAMHDNTQLIRKSVTPICRETQDTMCRVSNLTSFSYLNHVITRTQEHIDAGGEDAGAFRASYHWLGTAICLAFESCPWTDEHETMLARLRTLRASEPEPPAKKPDEFIPLVRCNPTRRIPCEMPLDSDCEIEETIARMSPTEEPSESPDILVNRRLGFIPTVRHNLMRIPREAQAEADCDKEEEEEAVSPTHDSSSDEPDRENNAVDSSISKKRPDRTGTQKEKSHHCT